MGVFSKVKVRPGGIDGITRREGDVVRYSHTPNDEGFHHLVERYSCVFIGKDDVV